MEKKKYELCLEVLRRFHEAGILDNVVLIGSWCLYFYQDYFSGLHYTPTIRTRDIDFLVPTPSKFKKKIDIPEMLKDLGFVVDFRGTKGYIRLIHPDLFVEFLVPERGKGIGKPYPLPQLGLNAQALRFLDFLAKNIIIVKTDTMTIKLPHPVAFAFQKLIIFQRRTKQEKAKRERKQALMILNFLVKKKADKEIKGIFNSMHKSWQKKVLNTLKSLEQKQIIQMLTL